MSWYKNLSRREFIQLAAATAAAGGTIACSGPHSPWRFLRVPEARTLAAVCGQLIPRDADPGAEWAQVVNFIDVQLCGPYRHLRKLYRNGIACVDRTALTKFGKAFAELNGDQQVELLAELERGDPPGHLWTTVDPRRFFETVLAHSMQGYYGDPRHGGNRAHASWKMLGLSYPPVRGRLKYDARKTGSSAT